MVLRRFAVLLLGLLVPAGALGQTLTPNELLVRAGENISVDWTAPSGHSTSDWVNFYATGDPNTTYGRYTTPPWSYTGSETSGTLPFGLYRGTPPGSYEYRYLENNGFTVAATSATVTVLAPCDGASITLSAPPAVLAGDSIDVDFTISGGAPEACAQSTDWVAMWPAGAADNTSGYGNTTPGFYYTNGTVTGTLSFTVNVSAPAGSYEFRYIQSGGTSSSAVSGTVEVLDPCGDVTYDLQASPGQVAPDGVVSVVWNITGAQAASCVSSTDWVAFYEQGAPDTSYGNTTPSFVYTGAALVGQAYFTLTGPPEGDYEFRYLRSGYVPAAWSNPVLVGLPSAVPALSPWGLAVASSLLLAGGWRLARRRDGSA